MQTEARIRNRVVLGIIGAVICLPLVAASAGAATVDTSWSGANFAGSGPGVSRPDGQIRVGGSGAFLGNNLYNSTAAGQAVATSAGGAGGSVTATIQVRIENDGSVRERFFVAARGSTTSFRVNYFAGTTDITSQVVAGTYWTAALAPGGRTTVKVVVKPKRTSTIGEWVAIPVTVRSSVNMSVFDRVKLIVTRT